MVCTKVTVKIEGTAYGLVYVYNVYTVQEQWKHFGVVRRVL